MITDKKIHKTLKIIQPHYEISEVSNSDFFSFVWANLYIGSARPEVLKLTSNIINCQLHKSFESKNEKSEEINKKKEV